MKTILKGEWSVFFEIMSWVGAKKKKGFNDSNNENIEGGSDGEGGGREIHIIEEPCK